MAEGLRQAKEKKGFVEAWGKTEETNTFLGFTIYGLIVFTGILLIILWKISTKPQPIYYIPGARDAGIAYPNQINKGSISGFASSWLLNRTNFNSLTVDDVYARAMRYMSPGLLAKTKAELEDEIKRIKLDDISSLFSLNKDVEINESDNGGYQVVLTGIKELFMGGKKLDSRPQKYIVFLDKVPPTEVNPYGFVISGIKQEKTDEEK